MFVLTITDLQKDWTKIVGHGVHWVSSSVSGACFFTVALGSYFPVLYSQCIKPYLLISFEARLYFVRWHFHFSFATVFRAGLDVRYISHPPSHVLKLLKALLGYFFNWQDLRIIEKLQVWYKEIIFPKRSKSELPIVCPITCGMFGACFRWTRTFSRRTKLQPYRWIALATINYCHPVLILHSVFAGCPSNGFCPVLVKVPVWTLALHDLACLYVLL